MPAPAAGIVVYRHMKNTSLTDRILSAKKTIKELKKTTPYIFNEYQELHWATVNLNLAKERFDKAKRAWDDL